MFGSPATNWRKPTKQVTDRLHPSFLQVHFLHPSNLQWLWLAALPVILWLFRRKAKRVPVSTLLFFRSLAREHQESAWLRRLKRWLALLLTLLVLAFVTLALARPYKSGGGDVPKSLVLLLDHSASMAAADAKGRTRLDEAKSLLKERLKSLPENVICSLVIYDSKPQVAQSRSTNRRELLRLLEQTQPTPVEDHPEEALAVAHRLAALDAPSEIWHVSDRAPLADSSASKRLQDSAKASDAKEAKEKEPAATAPKPQSNGRYRFLNVALEKPLNIGITGFQIRPAPLARNRFEAFVEVSAAAANEKKVEATLEARLDGRPVQLRQLELQPGANVRLILPLEGGKGQRLEMETRCPGDVLGWDNVAVAPLPEVKPLVVAWFAETPDPFVELALSSLLAEDRIQVLKGGAKDFPPKEKPDVYVFENWLPKDWPNDRPAIVLNPPSSVGPIHAKKLDRPVPYETTRAVQPEHPVLFRVASNRVAVTQTTVLNVSDTLETLWMAGQEPVLAAGEAAGQRIVVTAFVPSKSEQLALLSAFPLMMGNAIYWCAEHNDALASLKPKRPGDLVPMEPGIVKWHAWDGAKFSDISEETKSGWLELRHVGLFEGASAKPESSLLLSARESDVPAQAAAPSPNADKNSGVERWASGGGWRTQLLWLALAMLLVESWLFHRQAVY